MLIAALTEAQCLGGLVVTSTGVLGGLIATRGADGSPPSCPTFREVYTSGFCTAFFGTMPLNWTDVSKLRMQTDGPTLRGSVVYPTFGATVRTIVRQEGLWGLLGPGIGVACARDLAYSGIRVGLYPLVKRAIFGAGTASPVEASRNQPPSPSSSSPDIGVFRKLAAGMVTGGLGSALANPTDLVKIRIQAEAGLVKDGVYVTGLHQGLRPSYTNSLHAFQVVYREMGLIGFYRGASVTIVRAAMGTGAQLASYDHFKYMCKRYGIAEEGPALHVVGALISGLAFATAAAPADIVKSRFLSDPESRFTSPLQCLRVLLREEGPSTLFRGWGPSAVRICSMFVLMTPIMEQVRRLVGLGWYAA